MSAWRNSILVHALLLAGCGPRLVGFGDDESSTSSAEITSEASSTSEASTSDETSSTTSDETGLVFVPKLDHYVPEPCNSFAQDCPEGEKCMPYVSGGGSWDATKCVPVMGAQATGEPCHSDGYVEATDDCDATGLCWNLMDVDGELVGVCHAFCSGTPDDPSCPDGSSCQVAGDSPLAVCTPRCDPLAQDCDDPYGCYWANWWFTCTVTSGDLPTGAPCGYINDCTPGNVCVDAGVLPDCMGAACCTNFCNLELGPEQCDALPGTACVSFFEPGLAPPEYELVGVCIVMP